MAPGMEPMPPSTAAVKALMPAMKPMKKFTCPTWLAMSTPPMAASDEPMMNVREMMRSASMPSSMAILRFCAVARMALPIFVYWMNSVSAIIVMRLVMMIRKSLVPMMWEMGSRNSKSVMSCGKATKSDV